LEQKIYTLENALSYEAYAHVPLISIRTKRYPHIAWNSSIKAEDTLRLCPIRSKEM
jgi:hypothetical protein